MTKSPDIRAYFVASGFVCSPSDISEAFGLSPDDCAAEGDVRKRQGSGGKYSVKDSFWELRSSTSDSYNIEDYISDLISRMEPSISKFAAFVEKSQQPVTCHLVVVVRATPETSLPGMTLQPAAMDFLARNNISLVLDMS